MDNDHSPASFERNVSNLQQSGGSTDFKRTHQLSPKRETNLSCSDELPSQCNSFDVQSCIALQNQDPSLTKQARLSQKVVSSMTPPQLIGLSQSKVLLNCELDSRMSDQKRELQLLSQLREACRQIVESLLEKVELDSLRQSMEEKIGPIYSEFCNVYQNIIRNVDVEEAIGKYSQILIKYWKEEMFFQHFVENKFLELLMSKLREHKYAHEIIQPVFGCLEFLLKGLGSDTPKNQNYKQEQFIYLLVMINKVGFITEGYRFSESEDWAYYLHFIKLLVRIINQADRAQAGTHIDAPNQLSSISVSPHLPEKDPPLKTLQFEQKYSKYLTIFFNTTMPAFPLVLKLLHFYKWPDAIIQTSVKLCLLEISHHPNRKLQKYLINFPFITFYILYCSKVSDAIQKYLGLSGSRPTHQKQSEREEMLVEQIISDLKFMEDYLRVAEAEGNEDRYSKAGNIDKCLNMYVNSFMYYIGRGFYQALSKYASEENIYGLVNCMLLLVKILKVNTIVKIKLGFDQMMHKYINCTLWAYLKTKREKLDSEKWWIFDQCEDIIKEHAQNVLYDCPPESCNLPHSFNSTEPFLSQALQAQQLPSGSSKNTGGDQCKKPISYSSLVFKAVKSYIPTTNSNWLFYEMKKISEILGLEVTLNKQIEHGGSSGARSPPVYKQSFLYIIDQIQQYHYHGSNTMVLQRKMSLMSRSSSPIKLNPLFSAVVNLANKRPRHGGSGKKQSEEGKRNYEDNSEELLYYYLALACSIKDDQVYAQMRAMKGQTGEISSVNLQQICELLKIVRKCKSLMLVGLMYWYIKVLDYQLHPDNMDFSMPNENGTEGILSTEKDAKEKQSKDTLAAEILQNYVSTMAKLVYYILTEGWETFMKRIKEIKKVIWGNRRGSAKPIYQYQDCNKHSETQFNSDIFRDIDCDIVYFVMLRYIFGTRNIDSEAVPSNNDHDRDVISKEIKIPCRLAGPEGTQAYLVLDGQYIRFMTAEDVLITKKPLCVGSFNLYYQDEQSQKQKNERSGVKLEMERKNKEAMLELVDKNINGECFTVYFRELELREYAAKEIKWRKKMTIGIEMSLRTMKFQIQD